MALKKIPDWVIVFIRPVIFTITELILLYYILIPLPCGMKVFLIRRSGISMAGKNTRTITSRKSESFYSGINTRVIRLADVLLMMAEVENELGNIPDAIDYLNQVRNRPDVMMPNYGSPLMNTIYPVSSPEQIRKAIEHERKIELCSEQVRINDLIRWRRLEAFIREEAMPRLPLLHERFVKF